MKRHLLVLSLAALSLAGWISWGATTQALSRTVTEVHDLEVLNGFLLGDIKLFRERYEKLRAVVSGGGVPAPGTGPNLSVEIASLDETITTLQKENRALRDKIERLKDSFQKQMKDILAAKSVFEETLHQARQRLGTDTSPVRLGTLQVSAKGAVFDPSEAAAEGQVVSVDPMEDFVVVNLGSREGITPGTRFIAMQGQTRVAQLEAMEVREHLTACDVECILSGCTVKIDDNVKISRT